MQLFDELLEIDGVKAVKRQGEKVLKIELFTREIPGSEAVDIKGNLRSLTPRIKEVLDHSRKRAEINSWEWIERPEKKYQDRTLSDLNVSDRRSEGYRPGHYMITIEK